MEPTGFQPYQSRYLFRARLCNGSRFCDFLQGQNAREFEGNRFYDSLPSGVSPSVWPSGVSPLVFLFLSFFAQWRLAQWPAAVSVTCCKDRTPANLKATVSTTRCPVACRPVVGPVVEVLKSLDHVQFLQQQFPEGVQHD